MATLSEIQSRAATSRDERIANVHADYERSLIKIDNTYLFIQECAGLGLKIDEPISVWDAQAPTYDFDLDTDEGKFFNRVIKMVAGDLEENGMEPASEDRRKRLVRVYLCPKKEEFKHITFRYVTRLPKDAKCKLVKQTSKSTSIVCKR